MKLNQVAIKNYRNIKSAIFIPDEKLTLISGENGQGKTNLLESVWLLTGAKSFRKSKDIELIQKGQEYATVEGSVFTEERNKEIKIQIYGTEQKKKGRFASVNDVDYGRASSIAGIFMAVVFEPGHLSLVKSGPEGRRRFLDTALCQLYPGYLSNLRRFSRILSQKNALLKKKINLSDEDALLDSFDAELATYGEEISRHRREYLQNTSPLAENFYTELTQGREKLNVRFKPCCAEGALADVLKEKRGFDIKMGYSTTGPQREDFEVTVNDHAARLFASQGQQRSAVLALKLAEAAHVKKVTGNHPVMLLDDVLSELDEGRQRYLLKEIVDKQCIITTCDEDILNKADGKLVRMQGGQLQ